MSGLLDKTRRSTLFVIPSQVAIKLAGILYVIILARGLGVESYGVYNFVIGALLVFSYFCNFGLGSSLQRFIPEYSKLERCAVLLKTILFAHVFRLLLSAVVLFIANYEFETWSKWFNIEDRGSEFLAFSVAAFVLFHIEFLQIEFNALFMHGYSSLLQLLYTLLRIFLAFIVLEKGFGLLGVLYAEAIAYFIGLLYGMYIMYKHVFNKYKTAHGDKEESIEYKRIGRYSGYNALVMPGGILYSHSMDYFVIAAMANPYQLGIYALASRVSKMVTSIMPQNVLQSVIRPAFYHHYYSVDDKNRELGIMFGSLIRLISAFLFPSILVLAVIAEPFVISVFGKEYSDASSILVILALFSIFTILEFPSDMVLQAIEKVQARLYAQIFAVYNVLLAIYLMPEYGITGVAYATGSALMLKCCFFYYMARRYTGLKITWGPILRILVNALLASIVCFYVVSLDESPLILLIAVITSALVYLFLTYINNYMNNSEKELVNRFLKKEIFR